MHGRHEQQWKRVTAGVFGNYQELELHVAENVPRPITALEEVNNSPAFP